MNLMRLGAVALATFAAALIFTGSAEARWRPSGSYERTCSNIRFDGDTLRARCQRRDGSWNYSRLRHADRCDGRINNRNGDLECGRGWGHDDRARALPSGSYERTCNHARMDGNTLKATCRQRDGGWRRTTLDRAYRCDGNIANDNGWLVCRRWR